MNITWTKEVYKLLNLTKIFKIEDIVANASTFEVLMRMFLLSIVAHNFSSDQHTHSYSEFLSMAV